MKPWSLIKVINVPIFKCSFTLLKLIISTSILAHATFHLINSHNISSLTIRYNPVYFSNVGG